MCVCVCARARARARERERERERERGQPQHVHSHVFSGPGSRPSARGTRGSRVHQPVDSPTEPCFLRCLTSSLALSLSLSLFLSLALPHFPGWPFPPSPLTRAPCRYSLTDALKHVKKHRAVAAPNWSAMEQVTLAPLTPRSTVPLSRQSISAGRREAPVPPGHGLTDGRADGGEARGARSEAQARQGRGASEGWNPLQGAPGVRATGGPWRQGPDEREPHSLASAPCGQGPVPVPTRPLPCSRGPSSPPSPSPQPRSCACSPLPPPPAAAGGHRPGPAREAAVAPDGRCQRGGGCAQGGAAALVCETQARSERTREEGFRRVGRDEGGRAADTERPQALRHGGF